MSEEGQTMANYGQLWSAAALTMPLSATLIARYVDVDRAGCKVGFLFLLL
jgi:hypothetical protein